VISFLNYQGEDIKARSSRSSSSQSG